MRQTHLFEEVILEQKLIADSPKRAFYVLRLIELNGVYSIEKLSGASGKILDQRRWVQKDYKSAKNKFDNILKTKLNRGRKSPRIYRKVSNE